MKRRNFIVLSALGAGAIGFSYWYFTSEGNRKLTLHEPEDLSRIWDTETIMAMGSAYIKENPSEASEEALRTLLQSDNGSESEAVETIKTSITNDFNDGNTQLLDGWVIATTEARQCALFSIVQSN